jgi:hypothetical protein
LLPVTLLPAISRDDEGEISSLAARGVSLEDLERQGRLTVEAASRNRLTFVRDYMGSAFWAILRADLNDDGIEDLLVSTYHWATEGTLGFGDVVILTRSGPSEMFRIVEGVSLLPSPA